MKAATQHDVEFWTSLHRNLAMASRRPGLVASGFHNSDGSRIGPPDIGLSSANQIVSSSTTANTKGAWTPVLAPAHLTQDCDALLVVINWPSSAAKLLVDIGVGAAGFEVVIAANLMAQASAISNPTTYHYLLPSPVPAGTRIAARCQSSSSGVAKTVGVTIYPIAASWMSLLELSRITDYGSATATSAGTLVTASGTANTKGAYSQLVASTANDCKAIMVACGSRGVSVAASVDLNLDLAVGAAGSEQIIIPNLYFGAGVNGWKGYAPELVGPIPMDIPAGTRIAARAQASVASSALELIVYGLD